MCLCNGICKPLVAEIAADIDAYADLRKRTFGRLSGAERGDPQATAEAILNIVDAENPPLRFAVGTGVLPMARRAYADRLTTWEAWEAVSNAAQGQPTVSSISSFQPEELFDCGEGALWAGACAILTAWVARMDIVCSHLRKHFRGVAAVDDVSLVVPSGIFALLGANGAGKSTLLKILTGLLAPDSGDLSIAGWDVRDAKRVMGVVPEDLGLFDLLTVQEHLDLSGPVYGLSDSETKLRSAALLRILGLDRARETFLSQCSHGMRKKTALAMALLHGPQVLFLDEPFEGIDPVASKAIRDILRSASDRGVTVFLTSHTLPIVEQLTGRIAIMHAGQIVWRSGQDPRPLEEAYFGIVEAAPTEELAWLGSAQS